MMSDPSFTTTNNDDDASASASAAPTPTRTKTPSTNLLTREEEEREKENASVPPWQYLWKDPRLRNVELLEEKNKTSETSARETFVYPKKSARKLAAARLDEDELSRFMDIIHQKEASGSSVNHDKQTQTHDGGEGGGILLVKLYSETDSMELSILNTIGTQVLLRTILHWPKNTFHYYQNEEQHLLLDIQDVALCRHLCYLEGGMEEQKNNVNNTGGIAPSATTTTAKSKHIEQSKISRRRREYYTHFYNNQKKKDNTSNKDNEHKILTHFGSSSQSSPPTMKETTEDISDALDTLRLLSLSLGMETSLGLQELNDNLFHLAWSTSSVARRVVSDEEERKVQPEEDDELIEPRREQPQQDHYNIHYGGNEPDLFLRSTPSSKEEEEGKKVEKDEDDESNSDDDHNVRLVIGPEEKENERTQVASSPQRRKHMSKLVAETATEKITSRKETLALCIIDSFGILHWYDALELVWLSIGGRQHGKQRQITEKDTQEDGVASFFFGSMLQSSLTRQFLPLSSPHETTKLTLTIAAVGGNHTNLNQRPQKIGINPLFDMDTFDATMEPTTKDKRSNINVMTRTLSIPDMFVIGGTGLSKQNNQESGWISFISLKEETKFDEMKTILLPFAVGDLQFVSNWNGMDLVIVMNANLVPTNNDDFKTNYLLAIRTDTGLSTIPCHQEANVASQASNYSSLADIMFHSSATSSTRTKRILPLSKLFRRSTTTDRAPSSSMADETTIPKRVRIRRFDVLSIRIDDLFHGCCSTSTSTTLEPSPSSQPSSFTMFSSSPAIGADMVVHPFDMELTHVTVSSSSNNKGESSPRIIVSYINKLTGTHIVESHSFSKLVWNSTSRNRNDFVNTNMNSTRILLATHKTDERIAILGERNEQDTTTTTMTTTISNSQIPSSNAYYCLNGQGWSVVTEQKHLFYICWEGEDTKSHQRFVTPLLSSKADASSTDTHDTTNQMIVCEVLAKPTRGTIEMSSDYIMTSHRQKSVMMSDFPRFTKIHDYLSIWSGLSHATSGGGSLGEQQQQQQQNNGLELLWQHQFPLLYDALEVITSIHDETKEHEDEAAGSMNGETDGNVYSHLSQELLQLVDTWVMLSSSITGQQHPNGGSSSEFLQDRYSHAATHFIQQGQCLQGLSVRMDHATENNIKQNDKYTTDPSFIGDNHIGGNMTKHKEGIPFPFVLIWLCTSKQHNVCLASKIALCLLGNVELANQALCDNDDRISLFANDCSINPLLEGIQSLSWFDHHDHIRFKRQEEDVEDEGEPQRQRIDVSSPNMELLSDMALMCLIQGTTATFNVLLEFLKTNTEYNSSKACVTLLGILMKELSSLVMSSSSYDNLSSCEKHDEEYLASVLWSLQALLTIANARDFLHQVMNLLNVAIPLELRGRERRVVTTSKDSTNATTNDEKHDENDSSSWLCIPLIRTILSSSSPLASKVLLSLTTPSSMESSTVSSNATTTTTTYFWDSLSPQIKLKLSTINIAGTGNQRQQAPHPLLLEQEVRDWALHLLQETIDSLVVSSGSNSNNDDNNDNNQTNYGKEEEHNLSSIAVNEASSQPNENKQEYSTTLIAWLQQLCIACLANGGVNWKILLKTDDNEVAVAAAATTVSPFDDDTTTIEQDTNEDNKSTKKSYLEPMLREVDVYFDAIETERQFLKEAFSFSGRKGNAMMIDFDLLIPCLLILSQKQKHWHNSDIGSLVISTQTLLNQICSYAGQRNFYGYFDKPTLLKQCGQISNAEAASFLVGGTVGIILQCCSILSSCSNSGGGESSIPCDIETAEHLLLRTKLVDVAVGTRKRQNHQEEMSSVSSLSEGQKKTLLLFNDYVLSVSKFGDFVNHDESTTTTCIDPIFVCRLCFRLWWFLGNTSTEGNVSVEVLDVNDEKKQEQQESLNDVSHQISLLEEWLRIRLGTKKTQPVINGPTSDRSKKTRPPVNNLACAVLCRALLWPANAEEEEVSFLKQQSHHEEHSSSFFSKDVAQHEVIAQCMNLDSMLLLDIAERSLGLFESLPTTVTQKVLTNNSSAP